MRRGLLSLLVALPLLAGAAPVRAATGPYLLPFPAGTQVVVTEGNSEGDHEAVNGEQYAFDFVVLGNNTGSATPVVAARAGTVLAVQSFSGGCATWSCWTLVSFVLIDHSDGTSALYEFVTPKVKVGDHITQGQFIGNLAGSGFSTAPHVLFQLETTPTPSKTSGWWHTTSLPASFADPEVVAKSPNGIPTREGGPYTSSVAESIPTIPPIADVPINQITKDSGDLCLLRSSEFFLEEDDATVVAVEDDPAANTLWFAVTLNGGRLTRPASGGLCPVQYQGLTIWYEVDSTTRLYVKAHAGDNNSAGTLSGSGVAFITPYLVVGGVIFGIASGLSQGKLVTGQHAKMNVATQNAINRSIGLPNNRTNRAFRLYTSVITVATDEIG